MKCGEHAEEQLRMFCQDCNDPICIQCLLENHQQHKVQAITDAAEYIKAKLTEWCSNNRDETLQKVQSNKLALVEHKAKIEQDETMNMAVLENSAKLWKNKIENDFTSLSASIKKYFDERKTKVIASETEVDLALDKLERFDTESEALPLYTNLKKIQEPSNCFPTENNYGTTVLKVNEPLKELLIGSFQTASKNEQINYTPETRSIEIQTGDEISSDNDELSIDEPKGLISKISLSELAPITKILPLSETDALFLSGRKLYRLDISGIKSATYTASVDDIVVIRPQEFLVLNKEKSIILHLSKNDVVTPFTSTDPYMPICLGHAKSDNSVLIWMTNQDSKVMTIFDSYGVKKRSFSLPPVKSLDAFMSVNTSINFVIVYEVEQSTGRRNHVYAYNMEPRTSFSFSGKFGQSPYLQFVCKGLCFDDSGNVLCCDTQFNAVYKLDSKLEYQTILLGKMAGLASPSALAFKDGLFWVADNKFLRKYHYEKL